MALYHLSAQIISRGRGRSVVAAAAYRAGTMLVDERTGWAHNYSRRHDVRETFIMAPNQAPDWVEDRQALWSAVDHAEKRKDAQTAREVEVALPRELSADQQKELIRGFVQAAFVDQGMVADVAIHEGHNPQEPNPHAHILLTTRALTPDGFGAKNRTWNAKDLLVTWREQWAQTVNQSLEQIGLDERIDHRSYAAQGQSTIPTLHEGPHVRQMTAKQIPTDRAQQNAVRQEAQSVVRTLQDAKADLARRRYQRRVAAGWEADTASLVGQWEQQDNGGHLARSEALRQAALHKDRQLRQQDPVIRQLAAAMDQNPHRTSWIPEARAVVREKLGLQALEATRDQWQHRLTAWGEMSDAKTRRDNLSWWERHTPKGRKVWQEADQAIRTFQGQTGGLDREALLRHLHTASLSLKRAETKVDALTQSTLQAAAQTLTLAREVRAYAHGAAILRPRVWHESTLPRHSQTSRRIVIWNRHHRITGRMMSQHHSVPPAFSVSKLLHRGLKTLEKESRRVERSSARDHEYEFGD